jgi:hypothetical protein
VEIALNFYETAKEIIIYQLNIRYGNDNVEESISVDAILLEI